jgi:hypothetical protein
VAYKYSTRAFNMVDIYLYEKRLKSIENNIKNSKEINKTNKELSLKFRDDCFANGVGLAEGN